MLIQWYSLTYYFRCCWEVVSEDDSEDRDNRQPRHEARGQRLSAGQVRPPHYQLGRQWIISLRGLYNNLLVWGHHLVLSACDILRYSFNIFVNLYGQFLPIFSSNTYFLIWNTLRKQWLWSMMTRIISNVLAKRPLTAHNYLPGRKWWCFLLSSILSFFVGVFSVLFIRACAAVFCRKVKISFKKMWNHSKCFNSIWNILIKFLLSKCIYIEVKS